MNIIDGLIILLLAGAGLRGYSIGFVRQFGSTLGFLSGLAAGSLVSAFILKFVPNNTPKTLLSVTLLFACIIGLMYVCELQSIRLKRSINNRYLHAADSSLGSVMSALTLLVGLWLFFGFFLLAPSNPVQAKVNNSAIIKRMHKILPPATIIVGTLNNLVEGNKKKTVFTGAEPSPQPKYPQVPISRFDSALKKTKDSIVKIQGFGCGGISNGTGFVYAQNLVVTNAHVVAGVSSPKVVDKRGTHNAKLVLFSPENDVAVLKTNTDAVKPLGLQPGEVKRGTPLLIAGYPGGGDFKAQTGIITDVFAAASLDIFHKNEITRRVYAIQTNIVKGNSGGPVVTADGKVVGVVFATSTKYNSVGYALTGVQVSGMLKKSLKAGPMPGIARCSAT